MFFLFFSLPRFFVINFVFVNESIRTETAILCLGGTAMLRRKCKGVGLAIIATCRRDEGHEGQEDEDHGEEGAP